MTMTPGMMNFANRYAEAAFRGRSYLALLLGAASVAAMLFLAAASTPAQGQRIQISDLEKIVRISDPQISPDDRSIAVVVARANMKDDRFDTEIVLVDIATSAQRILTYGRKSVGSPRWSPSGDRLAFVAAVGAGKDAAEQIFVLPMSGGDAKQITNAPAPGVEQFAWRPDGKVIAYVSSDEPANKKEIEAHNDAFEVGDTDYLETSAALPSHAWLIPADGGEAKRLTSGSWSLPIVFPPSPPSSPLSWSADGNSLVITKQETPEPGDGDLTTLQILDVETGRMRKLTSHEKFESAGLFSPDGSQIAYWYPRDGDLNNENEIYLTPSSGGDGGDATRAIDRNIQRAIWMPDGKSLLVGGHDGTGLSLWLQPVHGQARKIDVGDIEASWSFWVDMIVGPKGDVAFTGSTAGHPAELYYLSSVDGAPKALTNFNAPIAAFNLGRVQSVDWQGPDGFREDGVLTYPPDFTKAQKYPLVLLIHGGPQASSTIGFNSLGQIIAAHGYFVFEPNYRGSDNLGNAYQRAIYRDAGAGPGRDVMAGLAEVEKMGIVDTNKIAVSGWSYGGYMTSWMIGHYHIWKAAVSGAAVNDLIMEATVSDGNRTDYYGMGGSPWVGDNWKIYREQSPITYAADIHTPTLILCDTGDFRVPIDQSYEMYHALKDNGTTVQFFAYPVSGHFPGDPVRIEDVFKRWTSWIDEYLK
ncbi:MAG TPA: S9 family peptidase [Candidatus Acidoferrales bacterium]|nr:S9 family peptidase [Candidatus Acidoferrales bacterium]